MAKKTAVTTRRQVIQRASHCDIPVGEYVKVNYLMNLTTPLLKKLLRAAGLGIPKTKQEMAERLATSPDVGIAVNTDVVVFGKPRFVKA